MTTERLLPARKKPPARYNKNFGLYIRSLRERMGYTQRELARVANLSDGYPAQIEGGRVPSDDVLTALARALHTTYDDLAERAGIYRPTDGSDAIVHVPADDALSLRRRIAALPARAIQLFLAQYDAASKSDDAALRQAMGISDADAPDPEP